MIQLFKNIFGLGTKTDYKSLLSNGAQIIDVRTANEYKSGHIKGSINMPLQTLSQNVSKINKDKVIITCCASGMRSASAKGVLKSNGFKNVYNGGGWSSLQNKIN